MKLKLIEKKSEVADVTTFIWQPESPISWQPGQYLEYHLPHENADDRGENRWFTIAAPPHQGTVQITTRFAAERGSSFKNVLKDLEIGAEIEAVGEASGDFVVEDPSKNYVFIAGGIGITPFRAILLDLAHNNQPINVTLLYGNRAAENTVFRAELEAIAAEHPSLKIQYVYEPQRIDGDIVKAAVPDLTDPLFYVSGPKVMVEALAEMLKGIGVPEANIKLDDFPGYD